MEKKDLKRNWKFKDSKVVFSLCLVGVAAFSSLFAMNQVKQAEKEKARLLNEQAELEQQEELFAPQVDEAVRAALEGGEGEELNTLPDQEETSGLEVSASGEGTVTADTEEAAEEAGAAGEAGTDESTREGGEQETGAQEADGIEETAALEAQTREILPSLSFADSDSLTWPVAGSVVLDYSMDGSIYFPTLQQYKYNPALVIGSDEGAQVVAAARGVVESIGIDEETGTTVTMSLGNGYGLKYGQLQELTVSEGDLVEQGQLIGYVSAPTKYYCVEGSNLFFQMTKDEAPVDPVLYLE